MNEEEDREGKAKQLKEEKPAIPKKKRKQEEEVTIAPSVPGGPDVSVE